MVLLSRQLAQSEKSDAGDGTIQDIALDLQVGRIPVTFCKRCFRKSVRGNASD